jgi:hypothetical protein
MKQHSVGFKFYHLSSKKFKAVVEHYKLYDDKHVPSKSSQYENAKNK